MEDNNQDKQGQQGGTSSQRGQTQKSAEQARSDNAENNPQQGDQWNNYQTKELAGNSEGAGLSAEDAAEAFEKGDNNG